MRDERREQVLEGVLLGTAVGDALGLPYEGMSERRVARWLGADSLRHRLVFRWGMVSDDTDHACLVALALSDSGGEPSRFARALARRLRWWLAALPAGVGFGTLRGIARLWLGVPPSRSGVWSAGNGPAMRAPLIGAYACRDEAQRRALVRASTRMTHADPRAEQGAQAIAAAAAAVARNPAAAPISALSQARDAGDDPVRKARLDAASGLDRPTSALAADWKLDRGISGYVYDTVPVVLHCWARHGGAFEPALGEIIRCGGDTDTTAAIVGGLCGATHGATAVPAGWLRGVREWPRSIRWMRALALALARGEQAPRYFVPGTLLRNAAFWLVVYGQIVRRALPPYGWR
jgi:ADP-ribosylglycohydrolase